MSTGAVAMMVVAMLVLWGGLVLAVVNLVVRSPEGAGRHEAGRDARTGAGGARRAATGGRDR